MVFVIDADDTGHDLKALVFERTGIYPHLQWISCGSRVIDDGQRLTDRGVGAESTVLCHLRTGGRPCEICSEKLESAGADEWSWWRAWVHRTYLFYSS